MTVLTPIFYDCEASDVEGYPIEIGWAFSDSGTGTVVSESYLIKPPAVWPVKESWDRAAEKLHGISLAQLQREGREVAEVANRMNVALAGRELFSDAPQDEIWLKHLFNAARLEPTFRIMKTDARDMISQVAAEHEITEGAFAAIKDEAAKLVMQRHRAEPDARRLAILWHMVTWKIFAPRVEPTK